MKFECIDCTSKKLTKIRNILPQQVYNDLRATNIFHEIKREMERIALLALDRYQSLQTYNDQVILNKHRDFYDKFKTTAKRRYRTKSMIRLLINYIEYLGDNEHTLHAVCVSLFKHLLKNDETFKNTIVNVIDIDFAKIHNQLIKDATFDKEIGTKNAILGVINYTTREQYKRWRYQV